MLEEVLAQTATAEPNIIIIHHRRAIKRFVNYPLLGGRSGAVRCGRVRVDRLGLLDDHTCTVTLHFSVTNGSSECH